MLCVFIPWMSLLYSSAASQQFLSEHDDNCKHVETRNLKNGNVQKSHPISDMEIGDSIM